jgi:hypothetical protein
MNAGTHPTAHAHSIRQAHKNQNQLVLALAMPAEAAECPAPRVQGDTRCLRRFATLS